MILVTTYNNEAHRKSITIHPLITCCSQGRALSLCLWVLWGEVLWLLSQISLGSLFQLLPEQRHGPKPQTPASLTTAAACVLTSESRRPRKGSSDQHIRTPAETSQSRQLTRWCLSVKVVVLSSEALWVLDLEIFVSCYETLTCLVGHTGRATYYRHKYTNFLFFFSNICILVWTILVTRSVFHVNPWITGYQFSFAAHDLSQPHITVEM